MRNNVIAPFAPAVIRLLQGPLYSDEQAAWKALVQYYEQARQYCAQIGLELLCHEEEGYAYLRQPEWEDEEGKIIPLPRLTRRVPLSRDISLLCILLREKLLLFETGNLDGSVCLLSRLQIHELLLPVLPERHNERLQQQYIDSLIGKVVELGFLRKTTPLDQDYFEVRPILKAKINADQLAALKERITRHGTTE